MTPELSIGPPPSGPSAWMPTVPETMPELAISSSLARIRAASHVVPELMILAVSPIGGFDARHGAH